ncbi:DUF3179 domain-containing protein [Halosimplex amylolyticum]|uniref:DUF3179 domain-containing protein n=1 Tax=Halosimplex amylolyticum TaxID=3396616 RepID=UPI003F56DC70
MTTLGRRRFLATASALGAGVVAGCGSLGPWSSAGADGGDEAVDTRDAPETGSDGGGSTSTADADQTAGDRARDPTDSVPTADETLPLPASPADLTSEARSGGPSRDGIPSIDEPSFVDVDDASFLSAGDPVFGVARGDTVKAYPQSILVHHEIVNDTVDGTSVAVTYCPLTGTVQGFERGDTTFGVSGRLINNNLVMYDRASETWWPQILATSVPGPWNEDPPTASLREFRLVWTTWEAWRGRYPGTRVLSTDTGHARNYGSDPYGSYDPKGGYYANGSTLFPKLNEDDRYEPKRVFMGARTPDGAVAFEKESLLSAGTMAGELAGAPIVAVADPRLATGYVYLNPDERAFALEDGRVRGGGETYAPDELPLTRVHAFDAMWFAWSGYYPDTNVYA